MCQNVHSFLSSRRLPALWRRAVSRALFLFSHLFYIVRPNQNCPNDSIILSYVFHHCFMKPEASIICSASLDKSRRSVINHRGPLFTIFHSPARYVLYHPHNSIAVIHRYLMQNFARPGMYFCPAISAFPMASYDLRRWRRLALALPLKSTIESKSRVCHP